VHSRADGCEPLVVVLPIRHGGLAVAISAAPTRSVLGLGSYGSRAPLRSTRAPDLGVPGETRSSQRRGDPVSGLNNEGSGQ